ncbi:hypothetical protein KFE25_013252 [Diacronema lutheri]|uniref:Amino acid transporter transmembrane domain-containing protein n=2 Tax=Diacronema lutheri TaxID=2081491 RepID=A0A8J5XXM2_DIALT|nr:hypothetical protein KFE25_013252 [Diacronema lutheri]
MRAELALALALGMAPAARAHQDRFMFGANDLARGGGARPVRLSMRATAARAAMVELGRAVGVEANMQLGRPAPTPGPAARAAPGGDRMRLAAVSATVFNLMIGTGAFCLPASAVGVPVPLALCVICALGVASAGTFVLLGQLIARTGARTFDELWRLSGPPVRALPSLLQLVVAVYSVGTLVQYQVSLGELLAPATRELFAACGARAAWLLAGANRCAVLLSAPLLLVGLLRFRDLPALTPASVVGVLAKAFSAALLVLRALDGSYAHGGVFHDGSAAAFAAAAAAATTAPAGALGGGALGGGALGASSARLAVEAGMADAGAAMSLVAASSTAFMCHLDIPSYYAQLERPSARRFGYAAGAAFAAGTAVYCTIVVASRALFGDSVASFALSSFSPADGFARAAQLLTALGVFCSYMLTMLALKTTLATGQLGELLASLLGGDARERCVRRGAPLAATAHALGASRRADTRLTLCVFALTTGLALCAASNLLFVVALRGAFLGTALTYAVPALIGLGLSGGLVRSAEGAHETAEQRLWRRAGERSRPALWALLASGCATMALATGAVLHKFSR